MMGIRLQYPKGSALLLVALKLAAAGATLMLLLAVCAICKPAEPVHPALDLRPAPSSQERGARRDSKLPPSSRFATPSSLYKSKGESRILRTVPVGRPPATRNPHIVPIPPPPPPPAPSPIHLPPPA